jgi:hypothetical protein
LRKLRRDKASKSLRISTEGLCIKWLNSCHKVTCRRISVQIAKKEVDGQDLVEEIDRIPSAIGSIEEVKRLQSHWEFKLQDREPLDRGPVNHQPLDYS